MAPTALERIAARARAAGGTVGVSATRLRDGLHLGLNEDELFPTASVIKVPLLVALYAEARAARIDLAARVTYRASTKVPGSGVLQDLDDGLTLTLKDLAMLMITVSDNTATDLLLERVGKDRVEAAMDALGLTSIRMPFSIRELLHELVDLPPDPALYEEARRRLQASAGSGGRAIDPARSDRATPRDLCRLFALLEEGASLDPASCRAILDMLGRQKFDTIIPARLPRGTRTAHKTGSLRGVRNDAGVVYARDGAYALAICSRGLPDEVLGARQLAEISLAVHDAFAA